MRPIRSTVAIAAAALLAFTLALPARAAAPTTRPSGATTKPAADSKDIPIFDGKTLKNWKSTEFGGQGDVSVEEGKIVVRAGSTLSGVNWVGPELPTSNYEIELDAMKLDGSDFFLGLTFPYKKEAASIILGGWGGGVTGISSINGDDAANNEFMTTRDYPKNKWFHLRLRVTDKRIQAWLNDEKDPFVDCETEGKTITTRGEIDPARPLGLSTYQTSGAFKNLKMRKL